MGLTDKFVVGVVGRLTYQKNPQFTVEIFAKVKEKRPNAVLMFIGQGELEEEIRRMVQAKGLTDSVLFLGLRTDVPDLMQAMDAFVLPSRFEGLGIVYIEAQAAGLKTFATAEVVPLEACVDESLFTYLPREATAQQWADAMLAADTTQREHPCLPPKGDCKMSFRQTGQSSNMDLFLCILNTFCYIAPE